MALSGHLALFGLALGSTPALAYTVKYPPKECAADTARLCPAAPTMGDATIACLKQHHISLTLMCRNAMAKAARPAKSADPLASP